MKLLPAAGQHTGGVEPSVSWGRQGQSRIALFFSFARCEPQVVAIKPFNREIRNRELVQSFGTPGATGWFAAGRQPTFSSAAIVIFTLIYYMLGDPQLDRGKNG